MNFNIVDGEIDAPWLGIIYGKAGSGKTFLANYAPDPLYLPLEPGCNLVPAKKFDAMPKTIDEFFEMLRYVLANPDQCETLVIDSLGFLEVLIHNDVVANNPGTEKNGNPITSISAYGFGKGYAIAMVYWQKLFVGIAALQAKGINVLLITHSHLKNATNAHGESYKATDFALQNFGQSDVPELLKRRADWVLHIKSEVALTNIKNNFGGTKTVPLAGTRPETVVYTRATSEFFAKVRTHDESHIKNYYVIDPANIDASSQALMDLVTKPIKAAIQPTKEATQ